MLLPHMGQGTQLSGGQKRRIALLVLLSATPGDSYAPSSHGSRGPGAKKYGIAKARDLVRNQVTIVLFLSKINC
jgi:hypothetical protein